jgi:hypothetical protein
VIVKANHRSIRSITGTCSLILVSIAQIGACNRAPVISELKADRTNFNPASDSQFTCIASDPDKDPLTYAWAASDGRFSGEGATVTWTAPERLGACKIMVTVRDDKGGEAIMEKKIKVGENHAPIIHSMISEYRAIERAKTGKMRCIAEDLDGDELTYTWTANRGAISGDGPNASWVAPNAYVNAIITVTVEDEWGRRTAKKLIQPVVCCDSASKNPDWK